MFQIALSVIYRTLQKQHAGQCSESCVIIIRKCLIDSFLIVSIVTYFILYFQVCLVKFLWIILPVQTDNITLTVAVCITESVPLTLLYLSSFCWIGANFYGCFSFYENLAGEEEESSGWGRRIGFITLCQGSQVVLGTCSVMLETRPARVASFREIGNHQARHSL